MTDLPKRKPMRLRGYDYSQNGYYFITICTKDRKLLFGDIVDGKMILNEYGNVVNDEITGLHNHYDTVCVDKYVIMPNHIHMIIVLNDVNESSKNTPTLSRIVQQFKGAITKQVGFSLWQKSFYEHIIRHEKEYLEIWDYIETNPLKWNEDEYFN